MSDMVAADSFDEIRHELGGGVEGDSAIEVVRVRQAYGVQRVRADDNDDACALRRLVVPARAEDLEAYPVGTLVDNVANEGAELIVPIPADRRFQPPQIPTRRGISRCVVVSVSTGRRIRRHPRSAQPAWVHREVAAGRDRLLLGA
jgi:hypothetical protein